MSARPMIARDRGGALCDLGQGGLQFKRRFWEEDEQIYGGVTYTDLPIGQISYPSSGFLRQRQGRAAGRLHLGHDPFHGIHLDDAGRARGEGRRIRQPDPSAVPSRNSTTASASPGTGCPVRWVASALWTEATRAEHYDNLCQLDGRIVLAGEHASYLPAWQEGAVTSALDAIGRLHQRALAAGAPA